MKNMIQAPKTVFIHAGTNDLSNSKCPDEVMGAVNNLIKCTKNKFPQAKIIINSITPRRDIWSTILYRANQNIRWLCKTSGVVFLDLDKYITNRHIARDGVHLNRRGTKMLDRVLAHVASLCDKIYPNIVNKYNFSSQTAQVEVFNQYNELKSS
ncbi:hypothetical protein J6590_084434 [Homalodisca vitripennis]|nr:hypothetical protein J6590_084434 [Homalodisca vitripennis]